jgi:signal transduction histidine kinase
VTTETHLLKMLGNGAPMLDVLNELCNFVDTHAPGAVSTVFLLDRDGIRLQPVAGPNAPKSWKVEIDNLQLGPDAGFCDVNENQERAVTVGSINIDPLFKVHRETALREGLQMACFHPILSVEKQVRGALALSYPQRQRRPEPDSEMMERAIQLAAIAIECYRNEQELRELSRRLSQSQDDERRRIARELHDSTGQKLAVLSLNLAMVEKHSRPFGAEFNQMLLDCSSLTRNISDEIRTLSYLLHPPLLDECGLEPALQMYFRGINRREGLEVEFEMPRRRLPRLSKEAELAIFRVVQASLTNIYLHSGSEKALVKIKYIPDGLVVTIRDHGRGIPSRVLERSSVGKGEGVGILGMKERIKQLGGRLEIETSRYGTQVKAIIPGRYLPKTEPIAAAAAG